MSSHIYPQGICLEICIVPPSYFTHGVKEAKEVKKTSKIMQLIRIKASMKIFLPDFKLSVCMCGGGGGLQKVHGKMCFMKKKTERGFQCVFYQINTSFHFP